MVSNWLGKGTTYMKIVFMEADNLGRDIDLSMFHSLGEVAVYGKSEPSEDAARIRDADIVIANKIPLGEALLKSAEHVKLICLTATGTNVVDFPYVNSRGITVTNVKGYSTMSVAQHTFALLFYVYEKLAYYDAYVKSGEYARSDMFCHFAQPFHELAGKIWGIVGLGEIGRRVAQIATAFGCQVVYYSTTGKNGNKLYPRLDFNTLLKTSNIISIHAPLHAATEKLFDAEAFDRMKKDAVLLNVGRGPIVDQAALADALMSGKIAGAGIDVLEQEPPEADDPLLQVQDSKKLVVTPHMAWATCEARRRCADEVYENIVSWMKGVQRNVVTE